MPKNKPQELITQYAWNRPASRPLNVGKCETQSGKKNLLSQIVEYSMNCINYAKREKKKKSVVQATLLKSCFTLSGAIGHVWPVNT